MQTSIHSHPAYSALIVDLTHGETIKAEPGAMVAQQNVSLATGASGGMFKGLKRMLSGESFFLNTFTANNGPGQVILAPNSPGAIHDFQLQPGNNLFIQSGSFLACTPNIQTDTKFQGLRSVIAGESLFFLRVYTQDQPGTVFYNAYGGIMEIPVSPGQELVVDTGHLVAFTDGVSFSLGKVGGLRSIVAGGEGLVMKFNGQGTVYIQTRNLQSLAEHLLPFLPNQGN